MSMTNRNKYTSVKDLRSVLDNVDEKESVVRISISIKKRVYENFKSLIGNIPTSTAINKILDEISKDSI